MGYSNFRKLRTVVERFNLDARLVPLFDDNIVKIEPSDWLKETLKHSKITPLTNKKSKAERIISPVLVEIATNYPQQITLFSGEDVLVAPEEDLSGECDFFFALHPPKPYIDTPIISLVEAKDEDMEWGLGQCAAQMYGAKRYNEIRKKEIKEIYGCATTGTDWQFLCLKDNVFYVHDTVTTELPLVLGIWNAIIQKYL